MASGASEGVYGGVGVLADVDCILEGAAAGVVLTVGEEQDEVRAVGWCDASELVEGGSVDGVKDGGAGAASD
jgi:hypothetical protein